MSKGLNLYRSYSFRDKDPIIDRLRTVIQDESASYKEIHENSGVATNTLYQWFDGETKRPQFATIMAVVRALGYDMQIVREEKTARAKITVLDPPRKRAASVAAH
jgi:DNA-binding phage protein